MGYSTSGFPVHHQLLELAQTYVHWVGDAIQPSHPLSSPSPPAFNLSQHQGLLQWISSGVSNCSPHDWLVLVSVVVYLACLAKKVFFTSNIGKKNWYCVTHENYRKIIGNQNLLSLNKLCVCVCVLTSFQFSCSVVSDSLWSHESQHTRSPLSITNSRSLLKLTSIKSVMPSSHLILLLLPPIPPSIRVFSNESTLRMKWPKYWSFSFNISPSNEHPGLISFRMDWLDLLAVQGILKSLLQHHSSKAPILWLSAFFTVQLSHPYMTTGKTIALTRWTIIGKVMSLLFNMLSRLLIIFLPRSKHLF